jgi:signal transduction histidine kinase
VKKISNNYLVRVALLWAVYWGAARVSVIFDPSRGFLAPIWFPSGLALAFLFVNGIRYWPGVFLGAYFSDAVMAGNFLIAAGSATGATLEAVVGAYLLNSFSFNSRIARLSDITALLFVSIFTAMLSALCGTLSLYSGNIIPSEQIYFCFVNWWGGDAIGNIVTGSFVFVMASKFVVEKGRWRHVEAFAAASFFLWITLSLFLRYASVRAQFPMSYFIFPAVLWVSMRFGQLGAVLVGIVLSGIGVWATTAGYGPFAAFRYGGDLFQFQLFLAVTIITTLIVAALATQTQEAIHVRDDFLSIASHELKTPLTSLQLHLHLLARMAKPEITPVLSHERLKTTLVKVGNQVGRITNLVNDLLDVTRIQAGKLNFKFEKVNLYNLTKEVLERFSEQLAIANCSLELDMDENIVGLWDPLKIEQVLINLITNAIKYAPGHPIKIVATQGGQNACLIVQDHGPGIERECQEKIFNRFERVTTSQNIGGLGLGLFISRQITEAHHGHIHVVSEVGKGARFILNLPLNPICPAPLFNLF